MKQIMAIILIALAVALVGCDQQTNVPNQPGTYQEQLFEPDEPVLTSTFADEEELAAFAQNYRSSGNLYYSMRGETMAMDAMVESAAMAPAAEQKAAGGDWIDTDYSETNVQVEGVDEADILKTDGNYIYTITGDVLYIIKAYPGEEAEVVSTITFDDAPSSLFIDGNYMAVFGNLYDLDVIKGLDFRPQSGMTYFKIYDIHDKTRPVLEKEYKFEGNYFNARMVKGTVYFVVRSQPEYRIRPMPVIMEDAVVRHVPVSDIYYYNIPYQNPQFVSVHAIDLADADLLDSKTVAVEGSQNLYMSEENIYITYTEWINEYEIAQEITAELLEPHLTDADRQLIQKIKQTDNQVLSYYEKQSKIYQIYYSYMNYLDDEEREELEDQAEEMLKKRLEEYEHLEFTVINKIHVENGIISVQGNGQVPGHIINQFSMDEYDGVFRIATTLSQRWSTYNKRTESSNNVYTLDSKMKVIGELEGLAETESIYATRFIGERLYMVTFRQVDPFFVIDLSNPSSPKELGQLKIPGFSRYLHPYDADTIIGIGQDATETGRTKGLKISLFDVSDVENPEEIAQFVTEERYAQSTALYEHKAFLFSREKELLVIPAYSYDWDYKGGSSAGYNGAFVFRITKNAIELRGLIDHSKAPAGSRNYYGAMVERSLYINELLYTKSPTLLRINSLDSLEGVKDVELTQGSAGDIKVY